MADISIPDGAAKRLRGYGYKPNGTQVNTDAIARMIARLPGVSNDPVTFDGIRYILERQINGNDSEVREPESTPARNGDNRKAGKGSKGKGRRRVTDVLPSI